MSVLRFRCGHGAASGVQLGRDCPICVVLSSAGRSRAALERRLARPERVRFQSEISLSAEYTWVCTRGHDRYRATVSAAIDGDGCPKCQANALSPSGAREHGVPGMRANLRLPTSRAEQRLRALLEERIRIPRGVNRVRIARSFHGRNEVWPDIVIPALKVAIEYDSPGRGGDWHRGLREGSDLDKDAALREVGWEVIRVRTGRLQPLGRYSIQASGPTHTVADRIVELLSEIRGANAVHTLRVVAEHPSSGMPSAQEVHMSEEPSTPVDEVEVGDDELEAAAGGQLDFGTTTPDRPPLSSREDFHNREGTTT